MRDESGNNNKRHDPRFIDLAVVLALIGGGRHRICRDRPRSTNAQAHIEDRAKSNRQMVTAAVPSERGLPTGLMFKSGRPPFARLSQFTPGQQRPCPGCDGCRPGWHIANWPSYSASLLPGESCGASHGRVHLQACAAK